MSDNVLLPDTLPFQLVPSETLSLIDAPAVAIIEAVFVGAITPVASEIICTIKLVAILLLFFLAVSHVSM